MKRLVAYSSVSHMAMVMLGMFALNPVGITGSIVQQINHGISTGALFLIVGIVYERRHTREISEYGGLSKVMPVYAAIFLIMTMSSIGLAAAQRVHRRVPDPAGRVLASKVWAAFAASGVVLGAAYMLYLYQRTMFGKIENPEERGSARSQSPRVRDVRAAAGAGGLDGPVSGAVPAAARVVRQSHHGPREFAVRVGMRRRCADCSRGGGFLERRAIPDGGAMRAGRQAAGSAARRVAGRSSG